METYLSLARYSSTGMKSALAEGLTARRAMYEKVVSSMGGTVVSYHVIADGDWDLATMSEFPEQFSNAAAARLMAAFRASGALSDIRTFRLATTDAFDAAAPTAERTYTPPSPT